MFPLKIIIIKININVFKTFKDAWVLYHVNSIDHLLHTYYRPNILEDFGNIFLFPKMIL